MVAGGAEAIGIGNDWGSGVGKRGSMNGNSKKPIETKIKLIPRISLNLEALTSLIKSISWSNICRTAYKIWTFRGNVKSAHLSAGAFPVADN